MQLCKVRRGHGPIEVGVLEGGQVRLLRQGELPCSLSALLHAEAPATLVRSLLASSVGVALSEVTLLAPIDAQEVWAAGVTYTRSREARERESEGAARFYDLVYRAER